jgi:hypothetical protein
MLASVIFLSYLLLIVFSYAASTNSSCTDGDRLRLLEDSAERLVSFGFDYKAAEDLFKFKNDGEVGIGDLVWRGKKGFMDLRIYNSGVKRRGRAPFSVQMANNGQSLTVDVYSYIEEDIDVFEWKEKIQSSWNRDTGDQNICDLANRSGQLAPYSDTSDLLKCFACFSIMAFTLPIIYNLILGYGFSAACQLKGFEEHECELLSMDFVMAMEVPMIIVAGLQTYERCYVNSDNCQNANAKSLPF